MDRKIKDRRRAVHRAVILARRRRLRVTIATLGAGGAAAWVLFLSPLLRIDDVTVVGARHASETDVVDVAGLDNAGNLLLLSTEDVERRIETLPWVASAEVDRMLPGSVRVRIKERRAALALSLGSISWAIDADGLVLGPQATAGELPILAGIDVAAVRPGDRLVVPAAVDALTAWRSLPDPLRADVRAIFAPSLERITLVLGDGTQVRYGAAEQMHAKNDVLLVLLRRLATEGATVAYIDVRVPSHPAVSDASMPSAGQSSAQGDGEPSPAPSPSA